MSNQDRIRVGVIGTGSRIAGYIKQMPQAMQDKVDVVALADPVPGNRKRFQELILEGRDAPNEYDSGSDLFANEDLDALLIGSPNHAHAADAIPAFERKIPVLLEKPVAINIDECKKVWKAFNDAGCPPVTVGFVLRFSPFYNRVKEMLDSGDLGQIMSIDADENIDTGLTHLFFRSPWRRFDHLSGGFMVEKCCHDFDIMNWLSGGKPTRVFSISKKTHFVKETQNRIPYFNEDAPPNPDLDYGDEKVQELAKLTHWGSLYEDENDLPDHQHAMVEYDNGVVLNFTACFAQPNCTRRVRVFGTQGYVEGDAHRGEIIREFIQDANERGRSSGIERQSIEDDGSGHHGADSVINESFWSIAAGKSSTVQAGIRDGLEAVLVGLAAEQSKNSGQPVDITAMRREVFGDDL